MRKRAIIGVGAAVLALALLLLIAFFAAPPMPVAYLRVVDQNGQPVEGATIAPDGLRPKRNGGHYMWNGGRDLTDTKPVVAQTDADGYARVAYPFYVVERLETAEISFAVDHPDFCPDRPFRVVAASPPSNAPLPEKLKYVLARVTRRLNSRPDPVVLKRGGIVRVTGYIGAEENVVTNLEAEISGTWMAQSNFWQRTGPLLWSRKIQPGEAHLRALHFPLDGPAMFSDAVSFAVRAGETNEFVLELKRGARVAGRLDPSVSRPVRNGRVTTRVFVEGHDGSSEAPVWIGWRPLNAEGEFVFESLPPGQMEIVGICDGFVSQNGTPRSGRASSQRLPQLFPIRRGEQQITLLMEPAASCEVMVLDPSGRPLAGAMAEFWPNVLWGGNGSTLFAIYLYNTEDRFRSGTPVDWTAVGEKAVRDFQAVSDENGLAVVRTLPAGHQSYSVTRTNYEMPILRSSGSAGRSAAVDLAPGETRRVTVLMQKQGTEALTH